MKLDVHKLCDRNYPWALGGKGGGSFTLPVCCVSFRQDLSRGGVMISAAADDQEVWIHV